MNIQKINGSYIADQDRILMRISTAEQEELRLWLTRRSCLDFLAKTTDIAAKIIEKSHKMLPNTAKIVDEFNQQTLANTLDYAATFTPQPKLPLGHEPVLIKALHCLLDEGETGAATLHFVLDPGKVMTSALNSTQLNALRLLMEKWVQQAQWEHPGEKLQIDAPTKPASLH